MRGIHRSPVNSPNKGQWCGALMFSLICVWINGWVNNREAGDLRRYRAHYDVTVMKNYKQYNFTVLSSGCRQMSTNAAHPTGHWLFIKNPAEADTKKTNKAYYRVPTLGIKRNRRFFFSVSFSSEMAWHRTDDKRLKKTHKSVNDPQWINSQSTSNV